MFALGTDRHSAAAESDADVEGRPIRRQMRIDLETSAARSNTGEPQHERVPEATHRRDVQATRRRTGQVLEIDTRGSPQCVERWGKVACPAKSDAWIAGDSELPWAVRGS